MVSGGVWSCPLGWRSWQGENGFPFVLRGSCGFAAQHETAPFREAVYVYMVTTNREKRACGVQSEHGAPIIHVTLSQEIHRLDLGIPIHPAPDAHAPFLRPLDADPNPQQP